MFLKIYFFEMVFWLSLFLLYHMQDKDDSWLKFYNLLRDFIICLVLSFFGAVVTNCRFFDGDFLCARSDKSPTEELFEELDKLHQAKE